MSTIRRVKAYQGRCSIDPDLILRLRLSVARGERVAGCLPDFSELEGYDGRLEDRGGHGPAAVIAVRPRAESHVGQIFLMGEAPGNLFCEMDADHFIEQGARPPGTVLIFEKFDLASFQFEAGSLVSRLGAKYHLRFPDGRISRTILNNPITMRLTLQTKSSPASSKELKATITYRPQDQYTHQHHDEPGRMRPEIRISGPFGVTILPKNPDQGKNGLGYGAFVAPCRPERLLEPVPVGYSRAVKQVTIISLEIAMMSFIDHNLRISWTSSPQARHELFMKSKKPVYRKNYINFIADVNNGSLVNLANSSQLLPEPHLSGQIKFN
jgi:hypothetical protein